MIVFHKLSREEIKEILDLLIGRVRTQVSEHELQLDLTDAAKDLLVDKGWDPAMGARPLRRAIQRYIEDPLADEVLKAGPDSIVPGTTVMVDRREEGGEEDDQPLSLELIVPAKPAKKKKAADDEEKQPVGVGAGKKDAEPEAADDAPAAEDPGGASESE